MTATLAPTTDLVMRAWLKDVVGVANAGAVLPADESSWSADGFVQFTTVGGVRSLSMPMANPMVQLDFWAINPGSSKAPWGQANALAETVIAATYITSNLETTVNLGGSYKPARILTAYFVSEPRRMWGEPNDSARFSADLMISWVETETA